MICSGAGAVAPYNNARRQQAVNTVAHNIGRGTGTAYHVSNFKNWFFEKFVWIGAVGIITIII